MSEIQCHDFILGPVDTDSISFCKPDQTPFSEQEQQILLDEINNLLPNLIKYDHDGYFKKIIVCAGKNYVLDDGKKVKIKGSALKATSKSPAMKEMINRIIQSILDNKNDFQDIYHEYIKEACNVKDIKRWSSRKTISEKTLNSQRTNESKIRDAIEGTEIVEGDRCWLYFDKDDNLKLAEQFDGNYNVDKLLQNCYDTVWIFESILDCETLFKNYKLKRNKKDLEVLLNG